MKYPFFPFLRQKFQNPLLKRSILYNRDVEKVITLDESDDIEFMQGKQWRP